MTHALHRVFHYFCAMHIGLIGCGHWGQNILRTLRELSVSVAVCELLADRRQQALRAGAQTVVESVDELPEVAGLIVATPASTHYALLRQLGPLGKPLFVEKPLATTYADALAIGQLPLPPTFLMHIWQYHAGIHLLGQLGKSGELGDIQLLKTTRTNWTSPRTDTDSLRTLVPHDLTIIRAILGYIPPIRAALAERHNGQIRGLTALLGQQPGCLIDISTRYADKRREVRLHGTAGVAVLASETATHVDVYWGSDQYADGPPRHERRPFDPTPPLQRELAAFLTYLAGGPPPQSPLSEGIEICRLTDELDQCSELV